MMIESQFLDIILKVAFWLELHALLKEKIRT